MVIEPNTLLLGKDIKKDKILGSLVKIYGQLNILLTNLRKNSKRRLLSKGKRNFKLLSAPETQLKGTDYFEEREFTSNNS